MAIVIIGTRHRHAPIDLHEPLRRGDLAGAARHQCRYHLPRFSIHPGKLHKVLLEVAVERLGRGHIHTGWALTGFERRGDQVIGVFQARDGYGAESVAGDALIGSDGIHSTV